MRQRKPKTFEREVHRRLVYNFQCLKCPGDGAYVGIELDYLR